MSKLILVLIAVSVMMLFTNSAFGQMDEITVSTDKSSYSTGETITISGTVTTLSGESVMIRITNPIGNIVLLDQVDPDEDGDYELQVMLAGAMWSSTGEYTVKAMYGSHEDETTFSKEPPTPYKQQVLAKINATKTLVEHDRLIDAADKLWDIKEEINANAPGNNTKLIEMIDNAIFSYMVAATPGGMHDYPVVCKAHYVKVEYEFPAGSTWLFTYSNSTQLAKIPNNENQNDARCIPYLIRGGIMHSTSVNASAHSLSFNVTSTDDGTLIVSLPRSVIDAKTSGEDDKDFVVSIDGEEINEVHDNSTPTIRILTIPFESGASEIEIVGTYAVPEFGAVAALILVVAITSIIIISAKTRQKFTSY